MLPQARRLSRSFWFSVLCLALLLLPGGCAASKHAAGAAAPEAPAAMLPGAVAGVDAPPPPPSPPAEESVSTPADKAGLEPAPPPVTEKPPQTPEKQPQADVASSISQLLIYTAQLALSVLELDKSLARVEAIAHEMGGMLAQRTDRQAVIRVPSSKFFDTLARLEAMGETLHKSVQVQDVGEEFRDLSLRLKNARQVRDRLAALLANAKTVEESLKVERELERLSAEIQRMEGRLKYLKDRAAYSTITISLEVQQIEQVRRRDTFRLPFPWLSSLGLGRLLQLH